jgi:hypothetical protein
MRKAFLILTLVAAVATTGCGGGNRSGAGKTQLTILAEQDYLGRASFHLSCRPTGGDVPSPSKACAAVERDPKILTKPELPVCIGAFGSGWHVTVSGLLDGHPVHTAFYMDCWTSDMPLHRAGIWGELEKHLLPLKHLNLKLGETKTFPPGTLHTGDRITCPEGAKGVTKPVVFETRVFANNGPPLLLSIVRRRDGSVTATCR